MLRIYPSEPPSPLPSKQITPTTVNRVLVRNFRRIRKEKKLTTAELGVILGVSQAKISYIENEKGVLSAADLAILSRRLGVALSDFYEGLTESDFTGEKSVDRQLLRFGTMNLRSRESSGIIQGAEPFEAVFVRSLEFLDERKTHHSFQAALILYVSQFDLRLDQIFSKIGNHPFLLNRALRELRLALTILRVYPYWADPKNPARKGAHGNAKVRLQFFAKEVRRVIRLGNWKVSSEKPNFEQARAIADFVVGCYDQKVGYLHERQLLF